MDNIQSINEILKDYSQEINYAKTMDMIISLSGSEPTVVDGDVEIFQLKPASKVKLHKKLKTYVDRVIIKADQEMFIFKQVADLMQQRAFNFIKTFPENSIVYNVAFQLPGQPNYARYNESDNTYELRYVLEIYEG